MKFSILLAVVTGSLALAADSLEDGFCHPPMSARPQTWWHWMNGNVSKEGITADLEAMKEIGLGGATLFDAGCGVPSGPLRFNSPEWFDMVKHAAAEARRLELEICLPNCSGWSSSGGPWNPPANSMKELVRTERRVSGPAHLRTRLDPLPDPHGFAADIAVLAVPVPAAELATMEKAGATVSAPGRYVRVISFPEPFAADGMFYRISHDWLWSCGGEVKVETSDDGERYSELATLDATLARRAGTDPSERYRPFPREVRARHYRFTFSFFITDRDPGDAERLKKTEVASLRIGRARSLSMLCDKTLAKRYPVVPDRNTAAPDQVVRKEDVKDVSSCLSADGTFDWEVPPGEWRIIRLGFAANGKRNHPASDCGGGFEVDKLSPSALDYHFEQYAAKLVRHLGPLAGDVQSGLAGILVDSYEIGSQNWTAGFETEFLKRRGYDLTPYLPVLAGVIVGSVDESERFLADFRRTVADLFVAGYSGALAKKCHQYGLKLWLEPYGNCPCDDLEYGDPVDLPMCEFWSNTGKGDRYVETGNASFPAHLAHVWGRRYVGAEAFTASPGDGGGRWTTTPFALKAQGDRAFAHGVNRLIFHRFAHQPFVKPAYRPGMTLGKYGMHLDRTQTWWSEGRPWMDYLARCQWMLQEGTFCADVLCWHGEEAPSRGGHLAGLPEDFKDHPVPSGYAKDVCSTAALKALAVENGRIVVPGGVRYAMLVLQDVEEMSSETLAVLGRIVAAGGTVVAPRMPTKAAGLWHYPHGDGEISSRAADIWARGVVAGGAAEGITTLGIKPDFICISAPEGLESETRWIHRRYDNGSEAYFVACPNENSGVFTCSFRIDGFEPELWDAESGKVGIAPRAWQRKGGRTEVTFELPPSGSTFVVFRTRTEKSGERASRPFENGEALNGRDARSPGELVGHWTVSFPVGWYSGGTETKTVKMDRLVDWTTFEDPDLRYFSGTATYAYGKVAAGELDLGTVKNFATVYVDGRKIATLWRPPYRCSVPAGELTVRVTNLWPNRMIGDERLCAPDCEWADGGGLKEIPAFIREGRPSPTGRKTFATWHHWTKDDDLLPSGLLGPVRLWYNTR